MGGVLRLPVEEAARERIVAVHRGRRERPLRLAERDEEQVGLGAWEPTNAFSKCRWLADGSVAEGQERFGACVLSVEGDWNVAAGLKWPLIAVAAVVECREQLDELVADGGVRPEALKG